MKTDAKYVLAIDSKSMIFTDPAIRESFFKGVNHIHVIAVVRHEEGELNIPDYVDIDGVKNVVAIPKNMWGRAMSMQSLQAAIQNYLSLKGYEVTALLIDNDVLTKAAPDKVLVIFKELCRKCDAVIGSEEGRYMGRDELEALQRAVADDDGVELYATNPTHELRRTYTHARSTDTCRTC